MLVTLVEQEVVTYVATVDEVDITEVANSAGIDLESFRLTEEYLPWLADVFVDTDGPLCSQRLSVTLVPSDVPSETLERLRQEALKVGDDR